MSKAKFREELEELIEEYALIAYQWRIKDEDDYDEFVEAVDKIIEKYKD